ncbi:phosphoglycerate mutase [Fusarium albosuccineum]|uniref:Phosphoglycerate mutase n=1 Tax=Fusarium albosuccineum TaxID=1237068 RepID=A0A8H4KZX6_9HYPO|nr:phosphoglycerate mutase [Fusarium albosuccineum]
MADFSHLARPSPEWTSFLEKLSLPPAPEAVVDPDIPAIRRRINSHRFSTSDEELKALGKHGVKSQTLLIVGEDSVEIPIRLYFPRTLGRNASVLLYFHGGGFFTGSLSTEDATCTMLAKDCDLIVLSVGYRLAPEWTTPAPFQDAWDARCWVLHNAGHMGIPANISLYTMGISAGACLAASIVIRERMTGEPVIQGQCLAVPWLCMPEKFPYGQIRHGKAAPVQCRNSALLSSSWVEQYARMINPSVSEKNSPIINPLLLEDELVGKSPPTHIMVCGNDPLRDHGMLLKEKLERLRFQNAPGNEIWDADLRDGISWMVNRTAPQHDNFRKRSDQGNLRPDSRVRSPYEEANASVLLLLYLSSGLVLPVPTMSDQDALTPRVFLVRHGETEWAKSGRYTGITDIELTAAGFRQVSSTAKIVVGAGKFLDPSRLAQVFVSPRRRATQTLELFLPSLEANGNVTRTEDIAEWDYGQYEGLKTHEIRELRKKKGLDQEREWSIWRDGCEGGESMQQVTERLDRFISQVTEIQQPHMNGGYPANVLVFQFIVLRVNPGRQVSHGLLLRCLIKRWIGFSIDSDLPMQLNPGAIAVLRYASRLIPVDSESVRKQDAY